ncbi:CHAT domain-containing protein [Nostoc sp. FACHB-133]|uniref:CHAT domain-containing protein n=1 Tax=Nostoc sp. FACHB-133 TaxID=2692835 RepID=UPI0028C45BF2|nr:CHAT domain-containing protein [Nostoc sp. FACHB-133]
MATGKPSRLMAQNVNKITQQAEFWTEKGHELLNQGKYLEALEAWKEATKIYGQLDYDEGVVGNLINQNLALQGLGLYLNACDILLEALKIDKLNYYPIFSSFNKKSKESLNTAINRIKPTPVNLLALQNLGDILRLLGSLDESEVVLKKTLSFVKQITPNQDVSLILLSLGNTKQSMYERSRSQSKWIEELVYKKEAVAKVQQNALLSLEYYQQINNLANASTIVKVQAQLQSLRLLLDFDGWLLTQSQTSQRFKNTKININQQIQPLIDLIMKNSSSFEELPINQSVYAKLNFSDSLNKTYNKSLQPVAIQYAESALQTAQSINNQLLQSFCWGILGKLKPDKSEPYFRQALGFAQSIRAWDVAYQWQQQLGDLYRKQGKHKPASKMYQAAIDNLTQVRTNLLTSNPDTQFFFYEKVEPVYRNYLKLLLENSSTNIREVIQLHEEFKITELENYLQCGKLNLISLNQIQDLDIKPTIIHVIDLLDSIEVISQSPKQPLHHHSIDPQLIKEHINNLVNTLQDKNLAYTSENVIIAHCQALYRLIIAPIKYLPASGMLVFTLDASFQSLPMGLLHDGKNYLIEHYGITGTLGSRVQPPKILPPKQLRAFIAGLSKVSPSFYAPNAPKGLKALPGVEIEIANVKKEIPSSKVLLNEEFLSPMLDKELSTDDFSIVHLTTHAQFSSVADRTMIFAWDKPITVSEFNTLLKEKTQSNQEGIELLVLSACQTAKGNKRSALGIAGVAAQAGARSTIATLWQVDANSSALLLKIFYQGLKDGLTKAEALRLAQLQMISNPQYQHPFHWAAFLLIGGWL